VVAGSRRRKLTYKEQRELEALPARIESLEAEHRTLNDRIAGPDFYKETPDAIREALARADDLDREVADAYDRWHTLESVKSQV
jgi:ATP-binding cassette subfamily F protein uup